MMRRKSGLSAAGFAVNATLRTNELAVNLRPYFAKTHWANVVGPQVAAVTQIETIRPGANAGQYVLVVRVKNSVWANELTLLRGDLIRRLNRAIGGQVLEDIHFKASGLSRTKPVAEQTQPQPVPDQDLARIKLSAETLAHIEVTVANVADDALRVRIRRSLIHAAQTDQWKREHDWAACAQCGTLTGGEGETRLCPLCGARG